MLYGQWLNRSTRVKPVLLTSKPLSNIVKANITRETGGVWPFRHKTAPRKGIILELTQPAGCFLSSHSLKAYGSPERVFMEEGRFNAPYEDRLYNRPGY
jgi:hypothetical protein